MLYLIAPATLLIINLILNRESLKRSGFPEKKNDDKKRVSVRYNSFILAASCYFMESLRARVQENKKTGDGVILASGMSEYNPESDSFVTDIFERADKEMYEDKQRLKSPAILP